MLILASQSPRRKELLQMAGYNFQCVPSCAEEDMSQKGGAKELTKALALCKAREVFAAHGEDIVIGSDTVVAIDDMVLGKPKDREEAKAMLMALSGRVHTVATGVAICHKGGEEVFCVAAEVEFYPLSDAEIEAYLNTNEYKDKAGAYGIQGFGALLIKGINGDFYTVMGLPIAELSRRLRKYEKFI